MSLYDYPLERYERELRRLSNPLAGLGLPAERPGPTFPALPEAEAEDWIQSLSRKGLGGLGYLGEVLSKPGRAVRGLLSSASGGRAHEKRRPTNRAGDKALRRHQRPRDNAAKGERGLGG